MKYQDLVDSFDQEQDKERLLVSLQVLKQLLLRYGKKLSYPPFYEQIQDIDTAVYELIKLLDGLGFLSTKRVDSLIKEMKQRLPGGVKTFQLQSYEEFPLQPLEKYLESQFGASKIEEHKKESDSLLIKIEGEGYSFKRSLDGDIDRLLK